jgi:hypothetical protein
VDHQSVPRASSAGLQGHEAISGQQQWIPFESLHMFLSFHSSRSIESPTAMALAWPLFTLCWPIQSVMFSHSRSTALHACPSSKKTPWYRQTPTILRVLQLTWDELRCSEWGASKAGGEGDTADSSGKLRENMELGHMLCIKGEGSAPSV